jgi:hypothetical protein
VARDPRFDGLARELGELRVVALTALQAVKAQKELLDKVADYVEVDATNTADHAALHDLAQQQLTSMSRSIEGLRDMVTGLDRRCALAFDAVRRELETLKNPPP